MMFPLRRYRALLSLASGICLLATPTFAAAHAAPLAADTDGAATHASPDASGGPVSALPRSATFWSQLVLERQPIPDAWSRLRDDFALSHEIENPRVAEWLEWYREHPHHVERVALEARPWLHWISKRLEAKDMPGEIALLPFIESGYDPTAANPSGATGLWQFMPRTGDAMGLERTDWYDGRRDVLAATDAALSYLRQLADRWYDGNMLLSLAGYNAGAGTVNAARRAAANRGEPIDYWHLRLPSETMDYVPRLLALSEVVAHPARYGVALPSIPDRTEFVKVDTAGPLTLSMAAELSGIDAEELKTLNPGFKRSATRPRDDASLVLPISAKSRFLANLDAVPDSERSVMNRYVVKRGDTLSAIAAHFGASVAEIRRSNGISGNIIRPGQTLVVPAQALASRH
ncbi:transglycosylase SLT domain-containing protein [Salinicola aestuarinus]|uniref:transglycosylase SLT domain-containing protein n=1 Tax=Salinicola aestuarinus TaxID=1949082 RepID=UPI001FDA9CF0|nr:transglycosylase SLT domain-containing protein [Salinicola aestuarinus]